MVEQTYGLHDHFIKELKELLVIEVQWIPSGNNTSDIFIKNVDKQTFLKHAKHLWRGFHNSEETDNSDETEQWIRM